MDAAAPPPGASIRPPALRSNSSESDESHPLVTGTSANRRDCEELLRAGDQSRRARIALRTPSTVSHTAIAAIPNPVTTETIAPTSAPSWPMIVGK
jgi:hypothetical protein